MKPTLSVTPGFLFKLIQTSAKLKNEKEAIKIFNQIVNSKANVLDFQDVEDDEDDSDVPEHLRELKNALESVLVED